MGETETLALGRLAAGGSAANFGLANLHKLDNLDWQTCKVWTTWIGNFAQFGQLGLAGWLPAVVVHGLAERFQLCRSFLEVRSWPLFLFTKFKGHGAAKLADLSITFLAEA